MQQWQYVAVSGLTCLVSNSIVYIYGKNTKFNISSNTGNDSTPICKLRKMNCYKKVEGNMQLRLLQTNKNTTMECNCLPACTSITYDADMSYNKLRWREYLDAVGNSGNQLRKYNDELSIPFIHCKLILYSRQI